MLYELHTPAIGPYIRRFEQYARLAVTDCLSDLFLPDHAISGQYLLEYLFSYRQALECPVSRCLSANVPPLRTKSSS